MARNIQIGDEWRYQDGSTWLVIGQKGSRVQMQQTTGGTVYGHGGDFTTCDYDVDDLDSKYGWTQERSVATSLRSGTMIHPPDDNIPIVPEVSKVELCPKCNVEHIADGDYLCEKCRYGV